MAYTTVAAVKSLLQIDAEITTYDTEIEGCIASSDAMIDSWLTKNGTTMPTPVPKNLEDATTYLAAWLFKRRREYEEKTASFWTEATRFFAAYVAAQEKTDPAPFRACQD